MGILWDIEPISKHVLPIGIKNNSYKFVCIPIRLLSDVYESYKMTIDPISKQIFPTEVVNKSCKSICIPVEYLLGV